DLIEDINAALVTAGIDNKVVAKRTSDNTTGIMLEAVDKSFKMIQLVDANGIVEQDFGWQDKQIVAEIAAAGANELNVQGNTQAPSDGKPGNEVVFRFTIDGGDDVSVHVLPVK